MARGCDTCQGSTSLRCALMAVGAGSYAGAVDLRCVERVLALGADVHAADADGDAAMHYAASTGSAPVLRALIAAGACVWAPACAVLNPDRHKHTHTLTSARTHTQWTLDIHIHVHIHIHMDMDMGMDIDIDTLLQCAARYCNHWNYSRPGGGARRGMDQGGLNPHLFQIVCVCVSCYVQDSVWVGCCLFARDKPGDSPLQHCSSARCTPMSGRAAGGGPPRPRPPARVARGPPAHVGPRGGGLARLLGASRPAAGGAQPGPRRHQLTQHDRGAVQAGSRGLSFGRSHCGGGVCVG